jgi:hypothetical protein
VGCSTSQTVVVVVVEGMITGNDRYNTLCPTTPTPTMSRSRKFVSLGLFIIDEFAFADATGKPTGLSLSPQERPVSIPPRFESSPAYLSLNFFQIGGGGTYATIGARVW